MRSILLIILLVATFACSLKENKHPDIYSDKEILKLNEMQLMHLTKAKLKSDTLSFSTYCNLGKFYCLSVLLKNSNTFELYYFKLYNSFNPLVRFFSKNCIEQEINKVIQKNKKLQIILFYKNNSYSNLATIKNFSLTNKINKIEQFWNEKKRLLEYKNFIESVNYCSDSYYKSDKATSIMTMKKYLTLSYIITKTDGGIQNNLLDSLELKNKLLPTKPNLH